MAFNVYVDTATRFHGFKGIPDEGRGDVEQMIADFRAGGKPLERTVTFPIPGDKVVLRWGDIRDMWIEEA
jgi:hypothetical protein